MDADRTLYLRNITPDITESLLYELFLQAGPLEDVAIKGNIAFVTFEDEDSVLYACSLFEGLKLYGNEVTVRPRAGSKFASAKIPSVPPFRDFCINLPDMLNSPHNRSSDSLSRSIMESPVPFIGYYHANPLDLMSASRDIRNSRSSFSSASYPLLPHSSSPRPNLCSPILPYWQSSGTPGSDERINRLHHEDRTSHLRDSTHLRHSGGRERSPNGNNHSRSSLCGTPPLGTRGHSSYTYKSSHDYSKGYVHR